MNTIEYYVAFNTDDIEEYMKAQKSILDMELRNNDQKRYLDIGILK